MPIDKGHLQALLICFACCLCLMCIIWQLNYSEFSFFSHIKYYIFISSIPIVTKKRWLILNIDLQERWQIFGLKFYLFVLNCNKIN